MSHCWEFLLLPEKFEPFWAINKWVLFAVKSYSVYRKKTEQMTKSGIFANFPEIIAYPKSSSFSLSNAQNIPWKWDAEFRNFFGKIKRDGGDDVVQSSSFPPYPFRWAKKGCMSVEHHFCGANRKNRFSAICGETTLKKTIVKLYWRGIKCDYSHLVCGNFKRKESQVAKDWRNCYGKWPFRNFRILFWMYHFLAQVDSKR